MSEGPSSVIPRLARGILTAVLVLFGCAGTAFAQFQPGDDNPAWVRWQELETPHFRIIYPRSEYSLLHATSGGEYLAGEYARSLEAFYPRVGLSLGMAPGSAQWGKTPVLLHTRSLYSNGAVVWAPKRMDLYTLPDPYNGEATPWAIQLSVHEQRHLSQMQFGHRGWLFNPLNWLFGEMVPGALAGVYPGKVLLEGDAVVAETGLTPSGRGRSGDFLTYYQLAWQNGDWRDYYRWCYGSFRDYAPDHYTLGYVTVGGARVLFDDPLLMQRYFDDVSRHPLRIGRFRKMLKEDAGVRRFREAFRTIQECFAAGWADDRTAREPFMMMERLVAEPRFATDYGKSAWLDGRLYAVKSGKVTPPTLVCLDAGGREEAIMPMSSHTGALHADPAGHRLYWSESVPDLRWGLAGTSRIRYYSPEEGCVRDLTPDGRLYNPVASPHGGSVIAAVEYPPEGGSLLRLLRAEDGSIFETVPAPAGVQLTEVAWQPDGIYALGLSDDGFALWRHAGRLWERVTNPEYVKMHNLSGGDGTLEWVSDRSGVNELYRYDVAAGDLLQVTSTPYGATDFACDGKALYFSAMTSRGMALFQTPLDSLRPRPATPQVHRYRIADALSAQEASLAAIPSADAAAGETRPYRKGLHLLHIHSWAPFAFDYDEIAGSSGDLVRDDVAPGATLLLQNTLGNFYGFANYAYHKDDLTGDRWRHSFHTRLTYTGLYPVLQARLSVGDRDAVMYFRQEVDRFGTPVSLNGGYISKAPAVEASFQAYVPLTFTKGGISRGLVPQIAYSVSNDIFSRERIFFRYDGDEEGFSLRKFMGSESGGGPVLLQNVKASLRGYILRPAAESQTYPSRGIGAEVGGFFRPGLNDFFAPGVYGYVYGYLPGLQEEQGLRLSATLQHLFLKDGSLGDVHLSVQPRGFTSAAARELSRTRPNLLKTSADYAIPFSFGDISCLSPVVYISHFTLTPHADLTWCGGRDHLLSVGADLTASLSNFLWMPFEGSFGIGFDANGGNLYAPLRDADLGSRTRFRMIFSMDF